MNRRKPCTGPTGEAPQTPGSRDKILAASLRLFIAQGVDATPTAQISREARVSTGTLFHHFRDKGSLVDELYWSIKRAMAEAIRCNDDPTLPTRQRLDRLLRSCIAWAIENPEKMRFLDQFYNSPSICEETQHQAFVDFSWMLDLIDAAVREGHLESMPAEFHIVMASRIISGILMLIEIGGAGMSREQVVENGLAMLWKS